MPYVFQEYVLSEVSPIRRTSFVVQGAEYLAIMITLHWSCQLMKFSMQRERVKEKGREKESKRERERKGERNNTLTLSVYQYLCLFLSLSLSILFSLNLLHGHDRERIHCILPRSIQRIQTNNGTRQS